MDQNPLEIQIMRIFEGNRVNIKRDVPNSHNTFSRETFSFVG